MSTTLIQAFSRSELGLKNSTETVYVAVKGFYNINTNTDVQCELIHRYLKENNFNSEITIYGDRIGNDRRVGAAKSHYNIVADWFGNYNHSLEWIKTRYTRSLIDRVTAVQKMLRNAKGIISLYVHKDEIELIKDFEQVVWKKNTAELDSSNSQLTDKTDSLSYFIYYEFDITKPKILGEIH
jgi:hypothetical protein